jgi:hypothetical protein
MTDSGAVGAQWPLDSGLDKLGTWLYDNPAEAVGVVARGLPPAPRGEHAYRQVDLLHQIGLPAAEHTPPELRYALEGVTALTERGELHAWMEATVTGAQLPGPFVEGVDRVTVLYTSVLHGPMAAVVLADHITPQGEIRVLRGAFVPVGFVAVCPAQAGGESVVVRAADTGEGRSVYRAALVAEVIGRFAHLLRVQLQDNARQDRPGLSEAIARALTGAP